MIFLLDNSASMQAKDVEPTRFAEAKRQIRLMIENMASDDTAMLIAFSDRADVRQSYTSDRRRLLEALDRIEPTSQPTDLIEALRAAAGLANPGRTSQAGTNDVQVAEAVPATMYIYSDGGFPPVVDFALGNLTPEYVRIGKADVDNLGVLTLAAQRNPEKLDQVQTLARIKNFGVSRASGTVSLMRGSELLDASQIDVEPGDEAALTFDLASTDASELRLVIDRKDQLQIDNTAYAVFSPPRRVNVLLVSDGNRPLEVALQTDQAKRLCKLEQQPPAYLKDAKFDARVLANEFDLVVFDRCAPENAPPVNAWWIDVAPPQGEWKLSDSKGSVYIADVDRIHPLMRYLELFELKIFSGREVTIPRGGRSLIASDVGPLLAVAPRDGYQDLVLGMPIMMRDQDGDVAYNTDWPIQRSWPVLVLNILQNLAGAEDIAAGMSVQIGATVTLHPGPQVENVEVTLPDGTKRKLQVNPGGIVPFAETSQPGVYQVKSEDALLQTFVVNLFSPRESDLKSAEAIDLGYVAVEATTSGEAPVRRELWRWLILCAIAVVGVEWWIYTRRVGI